MPDRSNDILITGIPRSGTTLVTALVDGAPDSVALNEPKWQYDWASHHASSAKDFTRWLGEDFSATRQKLLQGVPIPERRKDDGTAVTNYYHEGEHTYRVIPFTRSGLSADFTLAMKHNGLYLGALEDIAETGRYRVLAVVRHPVHVLASWNRAPIPPAQGKLPGAALHWPALKNLTELPMELLEKQVKLMDMMFGRLHGLRAKLHVVMYEKLVENPLCLEAYTQLAMGHAPALVRPASVRATDGEWERIAAAFKKFASDYRHFYPQL